MILLKLRDFYLFNFFQVYALLYHTVHLVRFDRSEISLFLLPFSIGWVLVAAAVVIIVIIAFAIGIILPLRYADATTGPQDTFIRPGFSYLLTYVGVTPASLYLYTKMITVKWLILCNSTCFKQYGNLLLHIDKKSYILPPKIRRRYIITK